jgi:hypothetical protein
MIYLDLWLKLKKATDQLGIDVVAAGVTERHNPWDRCW